MNNVTREVVREFVSANISPPSFSSNHGVPDSALGDKVTPSIMGMFVLKFQASKRKAQGLRKLSGHQTMPFFYGEFRSWARASNDPHLQFEKLEEWDKTH